MTTKVFPKEVTIGDKYGPAMEIAEQSEADEYFDACVTHSMEAFGHSREEAEKIERMNLGYYAGYYSSETRERVERLFRCAHPVFGAITEIAPPTDHEAQACARASRPTGARRTP